MSFLRTSSRHPPPGRHRHPRPDLLRARARANTKPQRPAVAPREGEPFGPRSGPNGNPLHTLLRAGWAPDLPRRSRSGTRLWVAHTHLPRRGWLATHTGCCSGENPPPSEPPRPTQFRSTRRSGRPARRRHRQLLRRRRTLNCRDATPVTDGETTSVARPSCRERAGKANRLPVNRLMVTRCHGPDRRASSTRWRDRRHETRTPLRCGPRYSEGVGVGLGASVGSLGQRPRPDPGPPGARRGCEGRGELSGGGRVQPSAKTSGVVGAGCAAELRAQAAGSRPATAQRRQQ